MRDELLLHFEIVRIRFIRLMEVHSVIKNFLQNQADGACVLMSFQTIDGLIVGVGDTFAEGRKDGVTVGIGDGGADGVGMIIAVATVSAH